MPPKPDVAKFKHFLPSLSTHFHKGEAGRIGIVGGSEEYTGAPYFSGLTSMKMGTDLCHIFCDTNASTAIKSYSPDLIVHPYLRSGLQSDETIQDAVQRVTGIYSRLHVLVVGPGLGRDAAIQRTAKALIEQARQQQMKIVIDADGLYLVQLHPDSIKNYRKAVLTPNVVEFKRLCETMNVDMNQADPCLVTQELSRALGGVTVVRKGSTDIIANDQFVLVSDHPGGLKRMGGQGDLLSGAIASFLAWDKRNETYLTEQGITPDIYPLYAAWNASVVVRESARQAFEKHGRSVLTSHMLEELGSALTTLERQ
ncbi:Ribokinase-like protein [Hesseltinella vesiculosa]|uniref:ATP-dependent (S)-NAD(P)H-hydrate dehydratase n=1 Tax=Hesseltinella vesiculosa TaxID=101127 RepID=A0A1X2GDY7_9FUNG|nr:Ribokinase-like protein [Hesseltinella vesiculosa]